MSKTSLEILFQRYLSKTATDAEKQELMREVAMPENAAELAVLSARYPVKFEAVYIMDEVRAGEILDVIIPGATSIERPVRLLQKGWLRYVAAAVIIVAIGLGIYYFNHQSSKLQAIIGGTGGTVGTRGDVAPGMNRAVLTINNDQNIDLSSDKTGININNTITYNDGEKIAGVGQLLQLTTPRGGQYQAVLPDGSRVWLNAASSIKFPSKFDDKERGVEVSGEAYFEIAKDATKPFKVYSEGQEIEVLGTSFNINVYKDEPTKKTTLITGSIKITSNNQTAILQPGQQANISIIPITKIKQIRVQTTDALAWKNGLFNFNNDDLPAVMRQLSRWYDITIQYKGNISEKKFEGKIKRGVRLSAILNWLSELGIPNKLEGRTLVIGH